MKNMIVERQPFINYDIEKIKKEYINQNIYLIFIDNKGSDLFASMRLRYIPRSLMKKYGKKQPYNSDIQCKQCKKYKVDFIDSFRKNKETNKNLSICIDCEEYNNGHNCIKCNKYILAGFAIYTQNNNNIYEASDIYKAAECKNCLYKSINKITKQNKPEPEIDDIIKYIEESEDTIIIKEEEFFTIPEEDN